MRSMWLTLMGAGAAGVAVAVAPQLLPSPPGPVQAQAAPLAPPVEVISPETRTLAETAEFLGRIEAFEAVAVQARVSGVIDEVAFRDGDHVNEGDLLFRIDPRRYRIALEQAEAALRQKREQSKLAQSRRARTAELMERAAASRDALEAAVAHEGTLAAEVAAAEAAVAAAKLDLTFTEVRAPISGRIGATALTRGNHVVAASTGGTVLASIVAVDRVKVTFDVDEARYLGFLADPPDRDRQERLGVAVGLTTDADRPHRGQVDFVDNTVDRTTGTVRVRAVLPNPHGRLAPGLFARVRLDLGEPRDVLLVDERAVAAGAGGRMVLVVGDDNTVEARPVVLGATPEPGKRVVLSGLSPNERVILKGLAGPGMKVSPVASVTASAEGGKP
ncbi:efflux RND transporter periplasmic adaptor subunit [Microvirga sp. GCM10011540]|uniref:efflux RND transporter periplasmic adaptor subunit n=1 Tax=Microvirga sp. GCM10011540 TaxID=3317338 RepID=UPI0036239367